MNLDEFARLYTNSIAEFKAHWEQQQIERPEQFDQTGMGEADWLEHFIAWLENKELTMNK